MINKNEILKILNKAKIIIKNNINSLPSNTWFIDENNILSTTRDNGDSRFPYFNDGMNMWCRTSGNINIEEGLFNIFPESHEGREPYIAFYYGIKEKDNYFPISITGAGKFSFEKNINRYTIYNQNSCLYITESKDILSALEAYINDKKEILFSLFIMNKSEDMISTYLSTYLNPLMCHREHEFTETKWFRKSFKIENGYNIVVKECIDRNHMFIRNATIVRNKDINNIYSTTSKTSYLGSSSNQLNCAKSLIDGRIENIKDYTEFNDYGICGDLIPLTLNKNEDFSISYKLVIKNDKKDAYEVPYVNIPSVSFNGFLNENINDKVFNYFVKNVFRQNEFCARAKNYAGPYIGIRDIFQQLESSLIWIPEYSKKKILEALNYIFENGRSPRQYSYANNNGVPPKMDLREFIDQGAWIISTIYKYLSYTNDFSILDEICGYYRIEGQTVDFSNKKDTVLEHMICIINYLVSNIDENTSCLKALYGDWNDALDGLGRTKDKNKEFGNGVSIMATLQLYKNLEEMIKILEHCKSHTSLISEYKEIRTKIGNGILKNAIVEKNNERKILHGWSDNREHLVCGFNDSDNASRDSSTTNSYFVLSDAIKLDHTIKKDILNAYSRLDSKYGIKTFSCPFSEGNDIVGRIIHLPSGTAENASVYIHSTLFAIMALFKLNEPEKAWEQIYKILPITHDKISTSPFVMPNSYIENKDKNMDGESMNDWFTGSGCVLIKTIIWYIFGINADLEKIIISMPCYSPFKSASINLKIKEGNLTIKYLKTNLGIKYKVNGEVVDSIILYNDQLKNKDILIEIEE